MDTDTQKITDIIRFSSLQNERKSILITSLEKNGITKDFFELFKQQVLSEAQGRKGLFLDAIREWSEAYASLMEELRMEEEKNAARLCTRLSTIDSRDTIALRTALDAHAHAQITLYRAYEKKIVARGADHTEQALAHLFQTA